jgi:hypothetical protein
VTSVGLSLVDEGIEMTNYQIADIEGPSLFYRDRPPIPRSCRCAANTEAQQQRR